MKKTLFLSLIFITSFFYKSFGQYATFSTDTTRLKRGNQEKILSKEWIINGEVLKYGSKVIRVVPNPDKIDTIYYKDYTKTDYDTIICNISEPIEYRFYYNTCCGGFNVRNMHIDKFISGKIVFETSSDMKNRKFIGTLGRAGIMLNPQIKDTLKTACRSAMKPNVYPISICEIDSCFSSSDSSCVSLGCLYKEGKLEPIEDFQYRILSNKVNFYYMQLNNSPLVVTYDFDKNNIKVKNSNVYKLSEVDQVPVYPGGLDSFNAFIGENIRYRDPAIGGDIEGRVYVKVIIEKNGCVTNVHIARGVNDYMNKEAMRVVKMLPNWKPAEVKGRLVRAEYILPVKFTLY